MKRWIQRFILIVFALEGVVACLGIYNNRQQLPIPFSQFTLIYKTAALGLVCFVVTTILGLLWLIYRSILTPDRYLRILQRTKEFLKNQRNCILIIFFMLLSIFLAGQISIQIQYIENLLQKSFLILTQPAWLWLILFCFEITILVLILGGYGKKFLHPNVTRPVIIFLILFSLGYGLIQMGYGYKNINTVKYNFDLTGFPIMGYQVILACIFAALGLLLEEWLNKHCSTSKWASPRLKDIVVAIALFLTAFLVWKDIPLTENTFFDQKQPPNYEYYPNSDALLYDRTAQNLLAVGEFQTLLGDDNQSSARRPALVFFQAIMHRTIGLGYEEIINLQVAVFSLLPVLLYILGSSLHSRASGLLAAILIILRERNALLLGGVITGVNSKLLMSEIPTMMGIILFLILFIHWVERPAKRTILPLLSGGVLGMTMLIRQEMGVIIPFAAIGAGLYLHKKFGSYLKNMVLVGFGILLVITPWIYRNWHKTGLIFLDKPGNRLYMLTNTLELDPDQIKQEDSFLLPDLLLNHLSNQLIQTVVYLPSNPLVLDLDFLSKMSNGKLDRYYGGFFYSPQVYVKSLPYWWPDWDGRIPSQSTLAVSLTLALIALGISGVWRDRGWIVSIPLLALIAHILIYTWIRFSGGRVLQAVDWITSMFYSIGLVELIRLGLRWLGYLPARANQVSEGLPPLPKIICSKLALSVIPVGLFVLGSSIPVVEYLTPNQYSSAALDQKATQLLDIKDSPFLDQERRLLIDFIDQGGQVVYARALYPRYFEPGESFYDVRTEVWGGLERDQEMRTEFYLAGTESLWGVLIREEPPVVFPHGSDVIAFGCEVGGSFDTIVVVIFTERGNQVETVLWRDGALEDISGCPLPWSGE